MTEVERYRALALVRVRQLTEEDETLRRWLSTVRLFGWPLFIVGLVFPIAAGVQALGDYGLNVPILSFLGAAAVAVHKGLHCDTYQQGLKRTIQSIRSIIENYEVIAAVIDEEVVEAFRGAEARLRDLRATSDDLPPMRLSKFHELLTT
jgi:hypothetical protein